jgi:cell division septation protein DedD
MRPLIVILVLANLAFAAWALLVDRPPAPPVARDISPLPGLVLASDPLPGTAPGSAPAASTAPSGHCVTVGPFSDLVLSAAAAALLQSRGFTPTQRDEPGQDLASYWVYLDNVPSEAAANRLLLMLRAIGLTDVHTMPVTTAGASRRVSVGLFTEREGADRRARAVKAGLGVTPMITEQHNSQASYWVDIRLSSPGQSVPTEGLLPPAIKGGHIEIRDCPGAPPK